MTDIRKFAVVATTVLHLRDANDQAMYVELDNGEPDLDRPMTVELYGPGSKPYKRAQAANTNRTIDRLKKKGKSDASADDQARETAEFLTACTKGFANVTLNGLQGEALAMAIYSDPEIGFIPEQVNKHIGDWANFTKPSPTK
jgi:hypothetical protein